MMSVNGAAQSQMPPPVEIITIMNALYNLERPTPDMWILTFSCPNGRKYQIPLDDGARKVVAGSLNGGLKVFGPSDVPGKH